MMFHRQLQISTDGCGACGFAGRGCPHRVNMSGVRLDLQPALVRLPQIARRRSSMETLWIEKKKEHHKQHKQHIHHRWDMLGYIYLSITLYLPT